MKRVTGLVRLPSLFALLLALAPGASRAADCIDWPHTLSWDDFKGPVPPAVTKAAQDAKQAHEKVGQAETGLKTAQGELSNKESERQKLINERNKELGKVDAEYDPKIKKALEERAKAAETPDDVKTKATNDVNNNAKLDANAKTAKLKKIDSDYQAGLKKYNDPANAKQRESKLAGIDKSISGMEAQKSARHKAVNEKYDGKQQPLDKEIDRLNTKVGEKEGELEKAKGAEEEAQKALGKVEQAATSATPKVGELEMETCGKAKDMPVKAVFCPDRSYVLPQAKKDGSPALLKHEQLHFDIAEKHARLFKQEVKKVIDAFNAEVDNLNKCHPKDLNDALQTATQELRKNLDAAQAKAVAAYNAEQNAYDHDPAEGPPAEGSAHGTNEANQKAWNDKIANDLKPAK